MRGLFAVLFCPGNLGNGSASPASLPLVGSLLQGSPLAVLELLEPLQVAP